MTKPRKAKRESPAAIFARLYQETMSKCPKPVKVQGAPKSGEFVEFEVELADGGCLISTHNDDGLAYVSLSAKQAAALGRKLVEVFSGD